MARLQSEDVIHSNYNRGKQTFIIPLTFTDINDARNIITRIGYGGDIWELRVDLLSPPGHEIGEVNIPPLAYVKDQVKALQAMSSLPVLFTIRTKSQGGKFPNHAAAEALDLMLLAIEYGILYIDVEIEWPQTMIETIIQKKENAKLVASYHSWTGKVAWTSEELMQKCSAANEFGDIIKLSILSSSIEDCFELGLFVRHYRSKSPKPILAVGMGSNGQLSRILSPISLVTHPLIPFPSAPGQLSLAQVHQALSLMGQLDKQDILVVGEKSVAKKAVDSLQAAFTELGYPHACCLLNGKSAVAGAMVLDLTNVDSSSSFSLSQMVAAQFTQCTSRPAPLLVIERVLAG